MFDAVKQLKQLKARRADLLTQSERLLATAAAAGRGLTDEEKQQDDGLHAQIDAMQDDLSRLERLMAADRAIVLPEEQGAVDASGGDPKCGFASLSDFARSVHAACRPGAQMDARLSRMLAAPTSYHSEAGTAEGYMVPAQFRQEIFDLVFADEGLISAVNPEPTTSNAVEFLADETTPWGAVGIQAKWRGEPTQMTPTKADTDRRVLRLHDLYAFVLASDDLLEDAPRLNARLTRKASDAIRYKLESGIVNGTGAGQPLGWMKSGALVTITKESGQAAATIVTANIAKGYARMLVPDGASPFVLANRDIVPQLVGLTIGNQPVWTPPVSGMTMAPGGFLMGLPIRWSEQAETLGTKGDIQFVVPGGYYAINKAGGIQFASSIHLYFDYGMQAFRWTVRFGGQPFLSAPVSPAKGSNTKSHFVCVETRS